MEENNMENLCDSCLSRKVKFEITEKTMEAIKTGQPVFFGTTENPGEFSAKYDVFLTAKKAEKVENDAK